MPRVTVLYNGSGVNSNKCQSARSQRPLTRTNDAVPISNATPFITESISRRHNDRSALSTGRERRVHAARACVRACARKRRAHPSTEHTSPWRHVFDTCDGAVEACVVAGASFRKRCQQVADAVPRASSALPGRGRSEGRENDTRFGAMPSR